MPLDQELREPVLGGGQAAAVCLERLARRPARPQPLPLDHDPRDLLGK